MQALTEAISYHTPHTLSETLDLLSKLTNDLKQYVSLTGSSTIPDPSILPLAAGLDTFQHQLITHPTLQNAQHSEGNTASNGETRMAILHAGRSYVERGVAARQRIGESGCRFVHDGKTVVVPANKGLSASRVVQMMLMDAARCGVEFRVVEVVDEHVMPQGLKDDMRDKKRGELQELLEEQDVDVAMTTCSELISVLTHLPESMEGTQTIFPADDVTFLLGASALMAHGGALVDGVGLTACHVARSMGFPAWIAAETGKTVKDSAVRLDHDIAKLFSSGTNDRNEKKFDPKRQGWLDVLVSLGASLHKLAESWDPGKRFADVIVNSNQS